MNKPVVSFCIATFQRYEALYELVQEILSIETDKIEVVVCDDKSSDDSVRKMRKVEDSRLKVYVNNENVGSSLNIYEALNKGNGTYLFYVNDRDNVDKFKIKKLIEILEVLETENVAFAKCVAGQNLLEKYHIFSAGKDALIQFACKIDHPTGYIFRKVNWDKIKNKRVLFENQNYGDFPITQVSAIMAKNDKGALIYGDICDLKRHRIDFTKVKSGYYKKRRDKKLWYTPEVIFRELRITWRFLKKLKVQENVRNQILLTRYTDYFHWSVIEYKATIADPVCTAHYGVYPSQDFFHVTMTSVLNGMKLWTGTAFLLWKENMQLCSQINCVTRNGYVDYFEGLYKTIVIGHNKKISENEKKENELYKREQLLKTYEKWIDAILAKKMISRFLLENGFGSVAIYGMGRIGRNLLKEFQNSDIKINYIIDQSMSKCSNYYEGVPLYNISRGLPYVDLIIVTIPNEAENIIVELRKNSKWLAKSINDILFVID